MYCSKCGAEKVEYVGFNSREGDPGNPWDCMNKSCGEKKENPTCVNPYGGATPTKSTFTLEGPHAKSLTVPEEHVLTLEANTRLAMGNKAHGHYTLYVGSFATLICDALGTRIVDIMYRIPAKDYLIGRDTL